MTQTATNPQTGETVYLSDNGTWEPAQTATNPQTGQKAILKGGEWEPMDRRDTPQQNNPDPQTWGEVGSQAASNFIPSAKQAGRDMVEPFLHPIDTVQNMWGLGKGVAQKLIPGVQADEYKADAVGKYLSDRAGNIKKTLANDPVGALMDLSMLVTGGGTALAKAPGIVGKVGRGFATVGNAIDPATLAVRGAGKALDYGGEFAKHGLGLSTGVGSDVIDTAFQSGKTGGKRGQQFADNLRGNVDPLIVLEDARQGLDNMRHTRHKNYVEGSKEWLADKTPLAFDQIDNAWGKLKQTMQTDTTNPHWSVSGDTQTTLKKIEDVLSEWRADPELHTAGGFDALKRNIDDLMPNKLDTGQSGRAVTEMRNSVKQIIVDQVEGYADTMADYEKAISLENEIKKTLSVHGNPDTAMRKLQSMMRDNVNTNFGQRLDLGKKLEQHGGVNLREAIAGQSANKWTPRGLQGAVGMTNLGMSMNFGNPFTAGLLPLQSPRLMGEMAYKAGQGVKVGKMAKQLLDGVGLTPNRARNVVRGAYQSGRIDEVTEKKLSSLLGGK